MKYYKIIYFFSYITIMIIVASCNDKDIGNETESPTNIVVESSAQQFKPTSQNTTDIIASYEKIHQHYLLNLPPDQKLFFNSHEQYLILGAQNGALIASVGDSAFVVYDKTTSELKILVYDSSKQLFKELYKDVSVIDALPELKGYGYSGTNVMILQGLLRDYGTTIIKDPLSWVNEFPLLKCTKLDQDSTFVLSHAVFANGYDVSNIGNYTCLCLPFDSAYNNWECFVYDKEQDAFLKIYGQAFAD